MERTVILISSLLMSTMALARTDELPSSTVRSNVLKAVASEMRRLDGEALYVRQNRAANWDRTVSGLQKEAGKADTWLEFMKALLSLDLAFPNLHSSMRPGREAMKHIPKRVKPKVGFAAEWLGPSEIRYVVSSVDPDVHYPAAQAPQVGDEIIEINGRKERDWKKENFELCKFPLEAQCDFELPSTFLKELLSWSREKPLTYTLKRNGATWKIAVDLKEEGSYFPERKGFSCKQESNRHPGFKITYAGNRACIFENAKRPGTAVLRIMGFDYSADTLVKGEPIDSLSKEIEALYPWWVRHATWSHLIFDVIDNHGGDAPIEYYQILFQHDFQEQYVTFKKTPEIESSVLRASIFWGSQGQEIWFRNLVSTGAWAKIPEGDFTEPVPMFCADDTKDCRFGLFPVRPHPFRGRISVLLNQWCVSSCDGFVYNLKEKFGARAKFYGHPQSADTAYARLTINIHLDPNARDGFRLEIVPLFDPSSNEVFMSQTIVVSRSTTADGSVVSGVPVPLDGFVPRTLGNGNRWPSEVLKRAL